jgi:predicted PurR-regulated permease PerM
MAFSPNGPPVREITISTKTLVRIILTVLVFAALCLLVWSVRNILIWVLIAALLATALHSPIARLSKLMPRWVAILLVYILLVLVPVGILVLIIPLLVTEAEHLVDSLPSLIASLQRDLNDNKLFSEALKDFDPLTTLKEQASTLPARFGDVASVLGKIGLGALNSLLALVTIMILSIFFVSSGGRWIRTSIELYGGDKLPLYHRLADRVSRAVVAYFAGTLLVAVVAGVTAYIAMTILGIPYAVALGVFCAVAALIPMFGATIAAVIIAIIAAVTTSWTVVLAWVIWEIIYQQFENNLIQPQIQRRTVQVPPVLTVLGVLFGSALLGVLGAIIAIPIIAAGIAIVEEVAAWNRGSAAAAGGPAFEAANRAHAAATALERDAPKPPAAP